MEPEQENNIAVFRENASRKDRKNEKKAEKNENGKTDSCNRTDEVCRLNRSVFSRITGASQTAAKRGCRTGFTNSEADFCGRKGKTIADRPGKYD